MRGWKQHDRPFFRHDPRRSVTSHTEQLNKTFRFSRE